MKDCSPLSYGDGDPYSVWFQSVQRKLKHCKFLSFSLCRWNCWSLIVNISVFSTTDYQMSSNISGLLTCGSSDSPNQDGRNSQNEYQSCSAKAANPSRFRRGRRQNSLVETLKCKTTKTLDKQTGRQTIRTNKRWKRHLSLHHVAFSMLLTMNVQLTIIRNSSIQFQMFPLFKVPSHGSWNPFLWAVSVMLTAILLVITKGTHNHCQQIQRPSKWSF